MMDTAVVGTVDKRTLTAGVDIGGTNTTVGIVDGDARVVATAKFRTDGGGGPENFVRRLATVINDLCAGLRTPCVLGGIGIASPAANAKDGLIYSPANLPWGTVDIVQMMKGFFAVPMTLSNDGDAAAVGEMAFGCARQMKNYVVVMLGTGLGAGIVTNGALISGEHGTAGELGHVTLQPLGRECGCGRRGCAETYVSATGVRRTASELLADRTAESSLRSMRFTEMTGKSIFEAAQHGDPLAREAFEITGEYLGRLLANVAAVFDPEAIILGGGLSHAGQLLLDPTRKAFDTNVLAAYRQRVDIRISDLPDGQAAILGASRLVSKKLQKDLVSRG